MKSDPKLYTISLLIKDEVGTVLGSFERYATQAGIQSEVSLMAFDAEELFYE